PDAACAHGPHRPAVVGAPAGEVSHDAYALGVRCPHREGGGVVPRARTEHRPKPLVAALADELEVELAERGKEAIRVVGEPAIHLDTGGEGPTRDGRLADALIVDPAHRVARSGDDGVYRAGTTAQGPDDGLVPVGVGSEQRVRIVDVSGDQFGGHGTLSRSG